MPKDILSHEKVWRLWIKEIAADPEMSKDRAMRHLVHHVRAHMPNENAPPERWEAWLGRTYNLLAILSAMLGIDPPHSVGVDLLFNKWKSAPADHTPPPQPKIEARDTSYSS